MGNNNLYTYKTPKSGNEETGFFNIKGRIARKAFFLRLTFAFGLYLVSGFFYETGLFGENGSRSFIFLETIHFYILPALLIIFILIQGAKRMHDVNKSGLIFLIPFYNLYFLFKSGTKGNNNFGIDPSPQKNIQFFDELESNSEKENDVTEQKSGLEKWRAHLRKIKQENPDKSYQEVLEIAKNTFKAPPINSDKSRSMNTRRSNMPLLLVILALVGIYFFYKIVLLSNNSSDSSNKIDSVYNNFNTVDTPLLPLNSKSEKQKPISKKIYLKNNCAMDELDTSYIINVYVDGKSYNWGSPIKLKPGTHKVVEKLTNLNDGYEFTDYASFEVNESINEYETILFDLNCACPFFYYKEDRDLVFGGELIRNLNSYQKEKLDVSNLTVSKLQKDTLYIVVKEEKPETSFLDEIYVTINDSIKLRPYSLDKAVQQKINKQDKKYFILKQGQEFDIYFILPKNVKHQSGKIFSYGYYLTNK